MKAHVAEMEEGNEEAEEATFSAVYNYLLAERIVRTLPHRVQQGSCHVKSGPTQKWSPGPILATKNGPPGPFLVAKNGPILPKLVLAGPNMAIKIGPGDRFWQSKVVPLDQFELLRMVLLPYSDC